MSGRRRSVETTRERITAAAFELHATIGPSRTTIKAIAERAGVQRHTMYAHFPDLAGLYRACTEHGIAATRMPSPEPWAAITDPADRLRHGLGELYGWYRANRPMLQTILHDIDPTAPPASEPDPFEVRMSQVQATLRTGWVARAPDGETVLGACITHAIDFETWRSLTDAGLSDERAVGLLSRLVEAVANGSFD